MFLRVVACVLAALLVPVVNAQVLPNAGAFPEKPLRLISPFPPGGGNDTATRIGTLSHLLGAVLNKEAGIDMTHIPYKGVGTAITDLLGGQVDALARAIRSPEVAAKIRETGSEVVGSTPAQFSEVLRADMARWSQAVRLAGLRLD